MENLITILAVLGVVIVGLSIAFAGMYFLDRAVAQAGTSSHQNPGFVAILYAILYAIVALSLALFLWWFLFQRTALSALPTLRPALESLLPKLESVAGSSYALWVNQSAGWPIALTIHAFGNAIVVGFIAIIALRLFGYFPGIPYSSLRSLIPYIWISIVFQAFSGFTLWMTKPGAYLGDYMFEVKFTLVIVASVVMAIFQKVLREEGAKWDAAGVVSS